MNNAATTAGVRARILVAEQLAPEGLALLRAAHDVDVRVGIPREEFLAILPGYDALLVRSQVQVDAEAIAAGKRLTIIGRAGVGVDNIDLAAATAAGIVVVNAPTGNTIAAAEHTLALLFSLARHIAAADASMRRGEWKRPQFTGHELRGKTLGIIGLGKIGMAVADRARGLEMDIVGHDPFVTEEAAALHGIRLTSVAEILAVADAVTVHVPLTRQDQGHDRGRGAGHHEAGRPPRQRRPRRRHRRGRPRRGAARGHHRGCRHRCLLDRAAGRRQPAADGAAAPSSRRTWARPRRRPRRASPWRPASRSSTSSPAAPRATRSTPRC